VDPTVEVGSWMSAPRALLDGKEGLGHMTPHHVPRLFRPLSDDLPTPSMSVDSTIVIAVVSCCSKVPNLSAMRW
jgi:hypothetical protein